MGQSIICMTKVGLFEKDLQKTAQLFKALGHPARLAILKYLAETGVCISGDISNELPLSRTTVNQHLQELKSIGIIKGEIIGVKVNYCIDTARMKRINSLIEKFMENVSCGNEKNC